MRTKLKIIFIITSIFAFNLTAQEKTEMEKIQSIIEELENKFAPDKRTAIFQINVENENDKLVLKGETNLPDAKEELLKKLNESNVIDQIEILPEVELGDKIYGIVNLSVANFRTKPDNDEEMGTQALLGTPLKVYKKEKGWYLVQTPDEYISWIDDDGFICVSYDSLLEWSKSEKVIYIKDFGFSYSSPDENSERISDLVIGDLLKYSGEENGFSKVIYPDGKEAFIKSEDCKHFNKWLGEVNPTPENILKTARLFMGIPYLWGGTSVKGMDCSGFTKTVFYLNGVILPRDASQQANVGEAIDTEDRLENLLPGDLLFFGRKGSETKKEKISHVAIYIGNGDYIHASGKVRINSFAKDKPNYNAYRDDSFVRAKRVLNSIDSNGVTSIVNNKFYNEKK
ncbi:MAG: glycoside hydrolase [Ignavibacteria bacterium RBG_16_34_14]|nr:MAG: glycoside hydrolase [Ignavibacteria bacterium RBG_16_34_14]